MELLDQCVQLAFVKPAHRWWVGHSLGVDDLQRTGTVATQLREQAERVARGELELTGDLIAHRALGQQTPRRTDGSAPD